MKTKRTKAGTLNSNYLNHRRRRKEHTKKLFSTLRGAVAKHMASQRSALMQPDLLSKLDAIPALQDKQAAKREIVILIEGFLDFLSAEFPDFFQTRKGYLEPLLASAETACNDAINKCRSNLDEIAKLLKNDARPLRDRFVDHLALSAKVGGGWRTRSMQNLNMVEELIRDFHKPFQRSTGGQIEDLKRNLSLRLASIFNKHDISIKQPPRTHKRQSTVERVSVVVKESLKFKTFDFGELNRARKRRATRQPVRRFD
jgi:hypothetical protein